MFESHISSLVDGSFYQVISHPILAATATTTTITYANITRLAAKPASLSLRRELPLWVGCIEEALAALKAQVPDGYMQSKQEATLAASLPPIAASLASIVM